jgi:hypothetical protein
MASPLTRGTVQPVGPQLSSNNRLLITVPMMVKLNYV